MKKSLLIGLAIAGGYCTSAQNIMPEHDVMPGSNGYEQKVVHGHSLLNRICLDVNMMHGKWNPKFNTSNLAANYPDALNTKITGLQFKRGITHGMDAELGYYFDAAGRYGVGTGFMFMYQTGELHLDNFHIEYRSTDNFNNTFRQSLTATGKIKENLTFSSISIPLLFKYKLKFSENIGFNADAGLLFTLSENVRYKTNAAFDYEAIYQYAGTQGNLVPVYDYSAIPAAGDFLLTRSQYLTTQSAAGIESYFDAYRNQGYNVGLGVKPDNSKGRISDIKGGVGIILRPSVNLVLSHAISVNAGVFYIYQIFSHSVPSNYRLTNKVGEYSSLANTISSGPSSSYGFTIGASYSFRRVGHLEVIIPVEDTSSVQHEDDEEHTSNLPVPSGRYLPGSPLGGSGFSDAVESEALAEEHTKASYAFLRRQH